MQSFKKKINTLISNGLEPLQDGIINFNNPIRIIEDKAKERVKICVNCPSMVDEPISFLAIKDIRISEISKKMCDECGCALPYKLRQSKSKCVKWIE